VEYGQQKQKPHNSLCGLGSWREQQQTIEANQKNCLPSDKTTQETMGFNNPLLSSDATQTKTIIHIKKQKSTINKPLRMQ
jgi:hypothetical protein